MKLPPSQKDGVEVICATSGFYLENGMSRVPPVHFARLSLAGLETARARKLLCTQRQMMESR